MLATAHSCSYRPTCQIFSRSCRLFQPSGHQLAVHKLHWTVAPTPSLSNTVTEGREIFLSCHSGCWNGGSHHKSSQPSTGPRWQPPLRTLLQEDATKPTKPNRSNKTAVTTVASPKALARYLKKKKTFGNDLCMSRTPAFMVHQPLTGAGRMQPHRHCGAAAHDVAHAVLLA